MASPGADSEQLAGRLSEGPTTELAATPECEELRSAIHDVEALSSEDRETVGRAILRIATAVEKIFYHLDTASADKPGPVPEIKWQLSVERLALSYWTSSNFLTSGLQKTERSVLTAFYTEGPGLSVPELEVPTTHLSDEDLIAAYSKDKWNIAPQRIFIESSEALTELQNMTKVSLRSRPKGMIPPFKLLVHHRQTIESRLDELRQINVDRTHDSGTATDDSVSQSSIIEHLQCIHNFIHTDLFNYVGLDLKIRNGAIEEVLFEEVYHLFKPGDLALSASTGDDQLYQVYSVTGGRMRLSEVKQGPGMYPPPSRWRTFGTGRGTWTDVRIVCFIMAWDGENIGPREMVHTISYYAGARRVTDLALYPIQFHKDPSGLRSRLRARGRKLVECSGHKRYTGPSVQMFPPLARFIKDRLAKATGDDSSSESEDEEESNAFKNTGMVRSDVYVDYKTFYSNFFATDSEISMLTTFLGEESEAIEVLGNDGKTWNYGDHEVDAHLSDEFLSKHRHLTKFGKPRENLDDDQERLELLPSQVPAFIFSSRKWEWLTLDVVEDLDKSEEARNSGWDELVIPNRFSSLLLSLVSNHISGVSSRQWETSSKHGPSVQIDLVRGKGRGLIILLHGPPGSGKTSTAETIAAFTGRPLYAITCGDIGTEPKELERNLSQHTRLAEKWGCVLLLDEADVFLMSRTYDNMHRNAMVSVFLRQLEYYSGILFLTTNIVGVIDEAFKSRIHVALEYPALEEESTLEIWSNLLQRIQRDNRNAEVKIRFDEDALKQYARKHYRDHRHNGTNWNGRQIRNAFQTAIGIGQYERLKKIEKAVARGEVPEKSTRFIRLTVKSFKTVAETASDFEKYITKTRGDDRERAAMHHFRRDDHSREPPPKKGYRTPVSMDQTDWDTGARRAGRSRRYAGASTSPGPRRTAKGKGIQRENARLTRSISDSEEHTGPDAAKHGNSDAGSDEDIIEQDFEDEDE